MPALMHRKWWEQAARRREGNGWKNSVRDSWLLAGLWVVRCWPDAQTALAVGCGKQFPSISDNFVGLY